MTLGLAIPPPQPALTKNRDGKIIVVVFPESSGHLYGQGEEHAEEAGHEGGYEEAGHGGGYEEAGHGGGYEEAGHGGGYEEAEHGGGYEEAGHEDEGSHVIGSYGMGTYGMGIYGLGGHGSESHGSGSYHGVGYDVADPVMSPHHPSPSYFPSHSGHQNEDCLFLGLICTIHISSK